MVRCRRVFAATMTMIETTAPTTPTIINPSDFVDVKTVLIGFSDRPIKDGSNCKCDDANDKSTGSNYWKPLSLDATDLSDLHTIETLRGRWTHVMSGVNERIRQLPLR